MTISYQYHGPCPTSVNPNWSTHTDEYVVCLLSGKLKKKIEEGYLRSLGHSRKSYLEMFPNAPMMANTSRQRMAEKTESRINSRRENLTTLNRREDFQEKRRKGVEQYWGSSNSVDRRRDLSNKAKEQHTNGLGEHINEVYWNTVYQGSAEQKRRRISASGQFSNFPKQPFRDTHLETMSTYEVDF